MSDGQVFILILKVRVRCHQHTHKPQVAPYFQIPQTGLESFAPACPRPPATRRLVPSFASTEVCQAGLTLCSCALLTLCLFPPELTPLTYKIPPPSHYLLKFNHSDTRAEVSSPSGSLSEPSTSPHWFFSPDAFINTLVLSSPICLLTPSTHRSGILILPSWLDGKSPRANVMICWFWEEKCWSNLVQFSPTWAGGWQMEDPSHRIAQNS